MFLTLLFIVLGVCLLFLAAATLIAAITAIIWVIELLMEFILPGWTRKHKE